MNGNITKEGIKLDLEWMHRVGLGGFQNFDAALATPQVVDKRLAYMTPEWKDAFKYATTLADQLGLEEAIAGSPGWSESGGPWVPASQGMKKYVWSETLVEGGKPFTGTLAHPPSNTGAFQNLGVQDVLAAPEGSQADSAVLRGCRGHRLSRGRQAMCRSNRCTPRSRRAAARLTSAMLSDGDLEKTTKLPIPASGESAWIQYEFAEPQTIRAITIVDERRWMDCRDAGRDRQPGEIPRSERRRAELPDHREASGRWRSRAHRLFPAGDGEVLPRRLQAHAASAFAGLGGRHRPRFPGDQDRPASHRL